MSDNPEDTDSRAEERKDGAKSRSLKDATHILKAEALRRYQLGNTEYDSEGAKTDDGREGSSSDKNVGETEKNDEILNSENPDSPSKGTDDDLNVTDRNADSANDEESRQDGSFGKDSAKPNEGNALEDSVYGDSNKSDKENVQKSDITEKEGGKPGSDVKDQDTDRGTDSVKEGETANEISSSKPQSEDTSQVSNSQDKPAHVRGSRPSSAKSRPVSSKARPTSGSEGSKKEEEGYQKPSSRPGSRDGNRSRPGSGADKRAKDEEQTQQQASGRGGSGTGRRSRPQSGDKRGAAGQGSGKVTQDGSTIESPGDTIAKKDGDLSSDGIIQTTDDLSQSKTNEGEIKEGDPATGNAASAANINEGVSLTEGKDLTKQGQGHHSDKSVSEKVVSDNSTEKINVENNFTSKQTGADDKLSDDVSPPMSEESKSKDHDESKQNPDSPSNNKQDPAVAEGNKEEKEGEHSKESKRDKETAESFDGGGQVDVRSIGREDSSEVLQTKDDSKDSQEQIVTTDKGKSSAEPGEGKKEQDGDADKSESVELESEKAIKKADQEGEDQGDTEGSSDAKVKEEGREGDASVDKTDDTKKDEKKKNKKKVKEEGVEKQESLEEDREEKADGTTKTDGEALQLGEPKQTAPGK